MFELVFFHGPKEKDCQTVVARNTKQNLVGDFNPLEKY